MTTIVDDQRAAGMEILANPTRNWSHTFVLDEDTAGLVGDAADWSLCICEKESAPAGTTVITPTVSTDSFANSVTFTWTPTMWLDVGIPARGAESWDGFATFRHDSDVELEIVAPFRLERRGTNTESAGSTLVTIQNSVTYLTAVAAIDAATITGPRRPLPMGARDIAIGDSIVAGTGSTLSSSGNTGDSRQAVGGWFSRLCGQHPDRYYKVRNAGIGGDIVGGLAELTADVAAGADTITLRVIHGNRPYNTGIAVYVGGVALNNDAKLIQTVTSLGDDPDGYPTYSVKFTTALSNAHNAGDEVGWGVHGRLETAVIDWAPDMVQVAVGTNDSGGTLTALEVAEGIIGIGTRLRAASIEPFLHELLPRTSYAATVVGINDELRYLARLSSRPFHLLPMWQLFAGGDGAFADSSWTSDGIHLSDLGHQLYADAVHTYMSVLSLRLARTPLAPMDQSSTNELAHACFLTGTSGGGGTVPDGWTLTQFFTTNTVPGIEAPAAGEGIIGQWATLTATAGAAGSTSLGQTCATFTIGDTLYVAARVKTTGVVAGFLATVQFLTGTFNLDLANQLAGNMDLTLVCTSAQIPSVTQSIFRMSVAPNGVAGKLWVAQPIVQNLTELERAA